jgi:Spy/CpxP family protein refolding chaperone
MKEQPMTRNVLLASLAGAAALAVSAFSAQAAPTLQLSGLTANQAGAVESVNWRRYNWRWHHRHHRHHRWFYRGW